MDPPKSLLSSLSLGRASRRADPIPHPLLGASSTSLPDDGAGQPSEAASSPSVPALSASPSEPTSGALPYKPRQRHERGGSSIGSLSSLAPAAPTAVAAPAPPSPTAPHPHLAPTLLSSATTAAATTTPAVPAMPSEDGASAATSKLQLQSLKAAAQRIGLGNGSMGMGMIDAIFEKGLLGRARIGEGGDWGEVLRVLISGKAIVILPSSPASSLPMTPQTLRDHIAFLSPPLAVIAPDGQQGATSVLVTLSGLIGTLSGDVVTFESAVPSDSPLLSALRDATARTAVLSSLRPTALSSAHLPTIQLSTESATLSFPPLGKGPAPITADAKGAKDSSKLGRINPFASLFGAPAPSPPRKHDSLAPAEPTSPRAPTDKLSPEPSRTSSPRPSLLSLDADAASIVTVSEALADGYALTAYVVAKPVRSADVHKALAKALRTAVRAELEPSIPDKLVDRVQRIVLSAAVPNADALHKHAPHDDHDANLDLADSAAAGERIQQLMEDTYDELVAYHRGEGPSRRRPSGAWTRHEEAEKGKKVDVEKEASEGTERVEALVCRLLYNRIFSPLSSDDARHDEALASRIAALNMLDLSLDHLGLITHPEGEADKGAVAAGLADLVDSVGLELQRLASPACLTPKEKADVLVRAHQIVVDGLQRLPPVELRPEGEPYRTDADDDALGPGEEHGEDVPDVGSVARSPNATPLADIGDADPLTLSTITEASEKTPIVAGQAAQPDVPDLVLPNTADQTDIAAAMSESLRDLATTAAVHADATGAAAAAIADAASSVPDAVLLATPAAPAKLGSTSGADLILPLIIFAVVKSNPAQLASQLQYLRRFRSAICLSGEASYAIVNLTAVVEFLEHVQLADLGLGGADRRVMSVADLSPIGLDYLDEGPDTAHVASASSRLRGRVAQVGELAGSAAGSAGKVIVGVTGVVDSFGSALRGLIAPVPGGLGDDDDEQVEAPIGRPGLRSRQASTFSLASVTASVASIAAAATTAAARNRSRASSRASDMLPAAAAPGNGHTWGANQEMVAVSSRPGSIRERDPVLGEHFDDEDEDEDDDGETGDKERERDSAAAKTRAGLGVGKEPHRRATVSGAGPAATASASACDGPGRVSIGNRLASIGVLGRLATPVESAGTTPPETKGYLANLASRAGSAAGSATAAISAGVGGGPAHARARRPSALGASPAGSAASLPLAGGEHDPPLERFLTCEVGDIRLHEVGALLRDYRRLAGIVARLQAGQASTSGAAGAVSPTAL
ncbi:hypothetical protein Q5752_002204 [Cryptotrichosporon argae]